MGNLTLHAEGNPICSFTNSAATPIESLKVYFAPKQSGSGDPSPSNVREIQGWNECEIYLGQSQQDENKTTIPVTFPVLGKNKFNKATVTNYYRINGSGEIVAQAGMSISDYISVIPGQTYTLTTSGDISQNKRHAYYDINKEYLGVFANNSTTLIIPSNAAYVRLTLYDEYLDTTQLELGDTATTYAAYDANNTVYGGYIDVAKGELVREYRPTPGEIYVNYNVNYAYVAANAIGAGCRLSSNSNLPFYCDSLPVLYEPNPNLAPYLLVQKAEGYVYFYMIPYKVADFPAPHTEENVKAVVKDWYDSNNLHIKCLVATPIPITYPLTSTQLTSLLGSNFIWSSTAEKVECDYKLHETRAISNAKKRIAANEPHIATASGGVATFNTDMKAPLKSCKIYFNPIQEGMGDPSPDNMRVINGWDCINCSFSYDNFIFIPSDTTIFPWTQNNVTLIYEGNGRYRFSGINETSSNIHFAFTISTYNYGGYCVFYLGSNKSAPAGVNRQLRLRRANETNMYNNYLDYDSDLNDYYFNTSIINGPITNVRFTLQPGDGNYTFSPVLISHGEKNFSSNTYVENSFKTIPINFSNTIYGGYVDLVTGEVVATHHCSSMLWKNIAVYQENDNYIRKRIGIDLKWDEDENTSNIKCNIINTYSTETTLDFSHYYLKNTSSLVVIQLFLPKTTDENTNIQICYKMQTPKLIATLTPTQLKTLIGTNNIWANTNGNIETQYWRH